MTATYDDQIARLTDRLRLRQDEMLALLGVLVSSESPSHRSDLLARTADLLVEHGTRLLGVQPTRSAPAPTPPVRSPPVPSPPGSSLPGSRALGVPQLGSPPPEWPVLRWDLPAVRSSAHPVVLLGHLDTVWPAGTTERWAFTVEGDRATGPGAFDMKAGLVQALFAMAELATTDLPRPPIVVLITSDEEIGSAAGRPVLEAGARGASAVLVLEASLDGALKVARKGVGNYCLEVTGRAAHAGLEPEKGVNALVAAAHLVVAVEALGAPQLGTTVTPTLANAGTTQNTVPPRPRSVLTYGRARSPSSSASTPGCGSCRPVAGRRSGSTAGSTARRWRRRPQSS